MSNISPDALQRLKLLVENHLPEARWTLGGVFRFDTHILTMLAYMHMYFPPRQLARVAGTLPGAWSLDMYSPRPMMSIQAVVERYQAYANEKVGIVLVFDNPVPPAESLKDEYAHHVVQLLFQKENNPTGQNAVCVASDTLAAIIRERCPHAKIMCHPNRSIVSTAKRTSAYYAQLEGLYDEIILHPRDAVTPSVFTQIKRNGVYGAVVNDPMPRNFPTRRELLNLLAEIRRRPYDYELRLHKERMLSRFDAFTWENTNNLTMDEEKRLYEHGIRSFIIQAYMFRNELTLLWDMFYHLLRTEPEFSNKAALVVSAALSYIRENPDRLASGTHLFSFPDPATI